MSVTLMACECWQIMSSDHSFQLNMVQVTQVARATSWWVAKRRVQSAVLNDGLVAGLFSPGLLAPELLSREPTALLWAPVFFMCHSVSFLNLSICGQGCVRESLGPQHSESSQLAMSCGVGSSSGQESRSMCKVTGSCRQLQIKEANGPREGGCIEWVGRRGDAQKAGMQLLGPGGPWVEEGPAQAREHPSLFSTEALGLRCCQSCGESKWNRILPLSLTPTYLRQETFFQILPVPSTWHLGCSMGIHWMAPPDHSSHTGRGLGILCLDLLLL